MSRKRVTQLFPWLLPLRKVQRKACFYIGMRFDGNQYASKIAPNRLEHELFETSAALYNTETGFDMIYQENKVFNLKLTAKCLHGMLIRPGETFSFWKSIKHAQREARYKEGLVMQNGALCTQRGGGLCQMSNLLFWMFLHTPLTIVERSGHATKDFPDGAAALKGVDATVSEGWIDLKVRNDTAQSYQILIDFDDTHVFGRIATDVAPSKQYKIFNGEVLYVREGKDIYEEAVVIQCITQQAGNLKMNRLYKNRCKIGYELPPYIVVSNGEEDAYA